MKALPIILIVFILFGCDSDDPEIDKSFSIEPSINQTSFSGFDKDDEKILIDFTVSDYEEIFSRIEISREFRNDVDTIKFEPITIGIEKFTNEEHIRKFTYSISELELYNSTFTDLDSVSHGSEYVLKWQAFDINNIDVTPSDNMEFVIDIKCDFDENFMIGDYLIESVAQSIFWGFDTYIKRDTILISKGDNVFERIVPITFGVLDASFKAILGCGTIRMSNEPIGASCNEEIIFFSETASSIDFQNDDIIIIDYILDYTNDCEFIPSSPNDRITLTRIE